MLTRFLREARNVLATYGSNLDAASRILRALFGSALKAYGVTSVIVVSRRQVTLTIAGQLSDVRTQACIRSNDRTVDLFLNRIVEEDIDVAGQALAAVLSSIVPDGDGAYVWIVPDGYMAELSKNEKRWVKEGGGYFSHESMCVQNTGARLTRCEIFVYFEAPGQEVLRHSFEVPAHRSIHLRLDKIPGVDGQDFIPKSTPAGYKIVSYDAPVVVQGSRILTSGKDSEFASFGTTMAWTAQ
ncbi:MAG TPA: sensory rhodopsin transducer [Planctomycetota bacterium]|jgi:hypothetical protein